MVFGFKKLKSFFKKLFKGKCFTFGSHKGSPKQQQQQQQQYSQPQHQQHQHQQQPQSYGNQIEKNNELIIKPGPSEILLKQKPSDSLQFGWKLCESEETRKAIEMAISLSYLHSPDNFDHEYLVLLQKETEVEEQLRLQENEKLSSNMIQLFYSIPSTGSTIQ